MCELRFSINYKNYFQIRADSIDFVYTPIYGNIVYIFVRLL